MSIILSGFLPSSRLFILGRDLPSCRKEVITLADYKLQNKPFSCPKELNPRSAPAYPALVSHGRYHSQIENNKAIITATAMEHASELHELGMQLSQENPEVASSLDAIFSSYITSTAKAIYEYGNELEYEMPESKIRKLFR